MSDIIQDPKRTVLAPYRICPIGAHSDHQGGPTLGMAVSAHTKLTFSPSASSEVRLESLNFADEVRFDLRDPDEQKGQPGWGRYPRAAALALGDRVSNGIEGTVEGTLPGGGLSSSASVLLAYLTALADANGLELAAKEKVELALQAERDFVGVKVGILDPAAIVGAKRDHLLWIDSRNTRWDALPLGDGAPAWRVLVAFTGTTRNLTATGYNRRVEECFEAVASLAARTGFEGARGLHDFTDAQFDEHRTKLEGAPARRARHFFTERARVRRGAELWRRGDLAELGAVMNASCESSIQNWEAGSPELVELQHILLGTDGVYGSRFSGAGFGGCVIALVDGTRDEAIRRSIERAMDARPPASVFLLDSDDGIRIQ